MTFAFGFVVRTGFGFNQMWALKRSCQDECNVMYIIIVMLNNHLLNYLSIFSVNLYSTSASDFARFEYNWSLGRDAWGHLCKP